MITRHSFKGLASAFAVVLTVAAAVFVLAAAPPALAQCPATVPAEGANPPGPLPLFPADNWWNADVSAAPVDTSSAAFIAFINNGGTRKLHPDFGGEQSSGSVAVYGMPWAIVNGTQAKQSVTFQYWSESDGVDRSTGKGIPYYPIPPQAITQPHWVEGGAPGNVDQRSSGDRHLLMIDCTNRYLYELYNAYYDSTKAQWFAGSGAFWDMNTNDRRPEGWTSADAAGLAIFPGLVRYDEVYGPTVTAIRHAFRVTVRSSNGHVFPASHTAGSTAGALPLGARLRLKTSVNGSDPALRTSDPNLQKIFRAMQKYGLIVADNGSDMFVSGTFDTRWDNSILNPAFALLSASDFEVIQLGWKPSTTTTTTVSAVALSPTSVTGGQSSTGTVNLSTAAPAGGAVVSLSSAGAAVSVPASVTIAQGATSATFPVTTSSVSVPSFVTVSATYGGATKSAILTVNPTVAPVPLSSLTLSPTALVGGKSSTGTVTLTAAAPAGGASVSLATSSLALTSLPANVSVPAGSTSATFRVRTVPTATLATATISATSGGVTRSATLTVKPPALSSIKLSPASVTGGTSSTGTAALNAAALTGGATVTLTSSSPGSASVPASVFIPAGATSATFTVKTTNPAAATSATISGTYGGVKRSATLTLNPSAAVSVAVSPTTASLSSGGSQTFTATVANTTNGSVTWSIQEGSPGGTVTSAGLYTAPSTAGTYHVVVTSVADTTKSATATVTVSTGTPLPPPPPASDGAPGGGGKDYHVGPGQAYTTIGAVPWWQLNAGDTVYIHYQSTPYHEKFQISGSGTPTQWIRVRGVPGPNGELPVISGQNATTSTNSHFRWQNPTDVQWDGVIHISPRSDDPDGTTPPNPAYIEIAGLQIQQGYKTYGFTAENGSTSAYEGFASCIYARSVKHLLVRDNVMTDCGQGFYNWEGDGSSGGTTWWDGTQVDTVLRRNYFYNNGQGSSYTEHQTYTESDGVLIEGNRYGPQRSGAMGSQLKDRSAGTVIRYNYLEQSPQGWTFDLVEPENGWPVLGFTNAKYGQDFVYGNVVVDKGVTVDPDVVHWDEDHSAGHGRAQPAGARLYYYDNTFVLTANQADSYGPVTSLFNETWGSFDCGTTTLNAHADLRNNIFAVLPRTTGSQPLPIQFGYCGTGNYDFGKNWVTPGWTTKAKTVSGTGNLIAPSSDDPGFVNAGANDFRLTTTSSAYGAAGALADAVTSNALGLDLTPRQQYVLPHTTPTPTLAPRTMSGVGSDLGALGR